MTATRSSSVSSPLLFENRGIAEVTNKLIAFLNMMSTPCNDKIFNIEIVL